MSRGSAKAVALLVALGGASCGDGAPPSPGSAPRERVERLVSAGSELDEVTAGRETRPARRAAPGEDARICAPPAAGVTRELVLGLAADRPGVRARLGAEDAAPLESPVRTAWSELRQPLAPAGGCFNLLLEGPAATRVAVAVPRIEQRGARRPWVVLYVVDTLRFDATPWGGAAEEDAPALAAFARDAVVYERAFSVTSWTRPAVATLLTGLGPAEHRVEDRQDRLRAGLPRLPQRLADAGWATAAVSTNPNVLPLWGFQAGFDRFVDLEADGWANRRGLAELPATVDAILGAAAETPLFLYVHDNGPHSPWTPPAALRERFGAPPPGHPAESPGSAADPPPVREARSRLYRATVRDTDDRFAALLSRLRALGRYQDALVVLVGDHGEEFGEHGDVSHGRTLYQEQLHVPLAIKLPGGAGGGVRIGTPVSTADVAGTLLAELGVTAGAGRTLPLPGGEPAPPAPIFSDLDLDGRRAESAVAWPWKYLRQGGQGARLFDLAADPEERRDAAADQPERLAELSAAVQHRRASSARGLWLDCSAGTRRARVILELALDPLPAERETLGLEPSDRVRVVDGGLRVEWELKPGAAFSEVELLDARAQARSQPDRDRLRLDPGAARALRVRSSGDALRLESAAGEALPGDGTPIPLADLASAGGAAPAVPGVRPICRLLHRAPGVDRVPEEAMSEALRERLRALGYLEE